MLVGSSCCGITAKLCHFARPASVDHRLHDFRRPEMGGRSWETRLRCATTRQVEDRGLKMADGGNPSSVGLVLIRVDSSGFRLRCASTRQGNFLRSMRSLWLNQRAIQESEKNGRPGRASPPFAVFAANSGHWSKQSITVLSHISSIPIRCGASSGVSSSLAMRISMQNASSGCWR
jgi:hypothetical protein